MNSKLKCIALLAGSALMLSSCAVYDYPMYTSASVSVGGHGWNTSVAWSNASYDVNGFPIYGYYYGRPVYGYTPAGAAIFSIAAITAACLVPDWGPAPWYCGHWRYPHHVHRVHVPTHCPPGHHPGRRPPLHAHHAPVHHHKPAVHHKPTAPHKPAVHHKPAALHKPAAHHKPAAAVPRPQQVRPQVNRPSQGSRPQLQRPSGASRPQSAPRSSGGGRPQMSRGSRGGGHRAHGSGGRGGHHR